MAYSMFCIDARKKFMLGTDSNWLYGDLDESVLKNVTLSYKESFKDASEDIDKEYNKMTAGIRNAMTSAIKGIQGLANSKIGEKLLTEGSNNGEGDTAATALELLAAITTFTGQTNQDDYDNIANLLNISSAYRIPTRNTLPNISIPLNKSIKVNFAYGKAGLYDAKSEVWDPIRNIWANLKPTVSTDGTYPNILHVDGTAVPLSITTKYYTMAGFAKAGVTTIGKVISDLGKVSVPDAKLTKAWTKALIQKEKAAVKVDKITDEAHEKMVDKGYEAGFDYEETEIDDKLSVKAIATGDDGESQKTSKPGKSYWKKLDKQLEKYKQTASAEYAAHKALMEDLQEKTKGLSSVLGDIVSMKKIAVNNVVANMSSQALEKSRSFKFMYIPKLVDDERGESVNYFSVDDLKKDVLGEGDTAAVLKPAITIMGIPTEVEIGFDYSQTDKNGYPLKGFIEIKSIWAVNAAGTGIAFEK